MAAAAARDDSMLQLPRRILRKSQLGVRNTRQARDTGQRIQPRQDVLEGVAVTTLILTETLATPSATFTQILTLAPSTSISQPERIPLTDDFNSDMSEPVPTSSIGAGMQTSVPNSATVHTSMGRTATTSSPTATAERGPASTTTVASGSSGPGIDIKALVPAIVGGAILLIIVAFLFGYCIRRRGNKAAQEVSDPEVVNEIERGYSGNGEEGAYGTAGSRRTNEKQQPQATSRNIPDINVDSSHARNRSLSKGTSQSKEGLLQSDYGKLGPTGTYTSEPEKRHAIAMLRRSTAQDSATIPHHLRHLRPESVSTDGPRSPGLNHISDEGEHFHRAVPMADRISKIGMALSTSDKSIQDDNISAVIQDATRQPEPLRSIFQQNTTYFEDTPPLYSLPQGTYFGAGAASAKPSPSSARDQPPEFGTVGSGNSSNQSRFAGRSDIATPSPPGTPTRSLRDRERDPSTSSRRSSKRGSGIFGLAAATMASGTDVLRPKSWDRKGRRWDKKRNSRGRGLGIPAGLEKRKGNKSRSRSRNNAMWTAWFDSSSEGEDNDLEDVVEPIPLPGGIVTSKSQSQRKKRVIFNSTSDISENPTVSSARTLTNSQ
ncbi:uncharacterized protein DFL_004882 [Arthrobotrys flagrans]|uniref:Uncharacterized protein n=1 Tax=Arthrobotrys flagrans TaxID=97331 RepID=A0A437A5X4_ARTFL|nr:hypothetical protein DFL_004882 [Arthrobotrys flagrans]